MNPKPSLANSIFWTILYFVLVGLIILFLSHAAHSEETTPAPTTSSAPTVQIFERVVPRACLISVQIKDPAKCHIKSVTLGPNAECRGEITQPLTCSGFQVELEQEDACRYIATRRPDCENVNVKRVPASANEQTVR